MSGLGQTLHGRSGDKCGHVGYYAESGSKFRVLASRVDGAARDVIQAPKLETRIMRYELSDYEWTAIEPMLPNKPRGVRRVNDRRVLNGIFWVLRSGAPWRDLPETYGPRTTCYNRFVRWRQAGVWDQIMDTLAAGHDAAVQMIDTSVVRVHQHGASIADNNHQDMGRSRGGLTSKIHAVVDTNGLPVHLALTPGEAHDNRLCSVLLGALLPKTMLLADRGYDADWIRELARQQGAWANIRPKRNRKDPICFSPYLYRARNLIERFFNKIKQCRRVATRYDKLAANYLAFVKLASIRIWLRANESTTLVSRISYPALARKIFRFAVCRNQLPSFRGARLNSGLPEFSNIDGASPESIMPHVRRLNGFRARRLRVASE
jgi:transposase